MQVRAAKAELRHKLFPPNAWIKVLHFNVLTSCPKDELHQWFIDELHQWDHAGAAIFIRSMPDCGTLAGPSLEWVAFRSPRPNGFAESPKLKRPGALGRPIFPEAVKRKSPAEDI